MEGVSVVNVETSLSLATMTSHDRKGDVLTISHLSRMTVSAMPLVHKYDCKALLKILQHAQNEQPNVDGILAIIRHDQEASQWMSEKKRERTEHEMKNKKLPHAILAKLFILFTMTEVKPDRLPRCPHSGGHYALSAVPGQLRSCIPSTLKELVPTAAASLLHYARARCVVVHIALIGPMGNGSYSISRDS
eukprot:6852267-Prymnesium_polylepis.1